MFQRASAPFVSSAPAIHLRRNTMRRLGAVVAVALLAARANAADQTRPGAGNAQAVEIARSSPLVSAAFHATRERARRIENRALRDATLDALYNENTCVQHRAGLGPASFLPCPTTDRAARTFRSRSSPRRAAPAGIRNPQPVGRGLHLQRAGSGNGAASPFEARVGVRLPPRGRRALKRGLPA